MAKLAIYPKQKKISSTSDRLARAACDNLANCIVRCAAPQGRQKSRERSNRTSPPIDLVKEGGTAKFGVRKGPAAEIFKHKRSLVDLLAPCD
jgi:hypothetical protein